MSTELKRFVGLVGVGYWGKNLLRDLKDLGAIAGICEVTNTQEIQVENPELYVTNNWNDFLNHPDITAVMIALPAEMHFHFVKQALLADKDVFVEKPLALDVGEAEELVELAKKRSKILMVGHVLRYHPSVLKVLDLVRKNTIGKIRYINCSRRNLGKIRQQENVLWSFAPHDISLVLALMNDSLPKKITCVGQKHLHPDIHDVTDSFLEFSGNCFAHISVNWLYPKKEQKVTIVGDKGMIVFNDRKPVGQKVTLSKEYLSQEPGSVPVAMRPNVDTVVCDWVDSKMALYRECSHFVECCQSRQDPITNGEEGLRVLRVLDACHEQLMKGSGGGIPLAVHSPSHRYFQHPTAIVDSDAVIGEGTKVWHYSHVMKAKVGNDCSIGQNCFIANNAVLGNNCRVQNNVSVYEGVICGNDVFLGPSMVFCNDKTPRAAYSKNGQYMKTIVEDGVSIGANATILPGVRLKKGCMVGAGAVVTKDVPPYTAVIGNPARVHAKVSKSGEILKI